MIYKSILHTIVGTLLLTTDEDSVLSISIINGSFIKNEIINNAWPKVMIDLKSQLFKYFNKELKYFKIKLNFSKFSTFQQEVYNFVLKTNYGELISYKDIGDNLNSKAYRAIGTIMKKNPFPIIVPCHRVILNSNKLGQYSLGNNENKRVLIDFELQ